MADDVELKDLYRRAAEELKVVEINEPLSAEDEKVFAERYPGVWAMLEGRGLAQWGEDDPVPQRYVLPVTALLASQCMHAFQEEYDASWAIPELSRQVAPDYRYDEVTFQDF